MSWKTVKPRTPGALPEINETPPSSSPIDKQMICVTCAISLTNRERPVQDDHKNHLIVIADVMVCFPVPGVS